MIHLLQVLERRSRPFLILAGVVFVAVVGVVDFVTGFELYFSGFYLIGIGLATWYVGREYGLVLSILSVLVGVASDLAAGKRYSSPLIPVWNSAILLTSYCVMVVLLSRLQALHRDLEERVRQRTQALTEEIAQRERLEKEILEVSEREQRRIGRDLHDGLCQHLTGTALAGQVLREKLAARSAPEIADAAQVVRLVEDGITMARDLAHGTYRADMEAQGLPTALRELTASISHLSKVICVFDYSRPAPIRDGTTAMHLYRIAQEAIANAIRHGRAKSIVVDLAGENDRVVLTIEDDGGGLVDGWQKNAGLGTRIMAHRAAMIGGEFVMDLNPTGGTLVKCSLPIRAPSGDNEALSV